MAIIQGVDYLLNSNQNNFLILQQFEKYQC